MIDFQGSWQYVMSEAETSDPSMFLSPHCVPTLPALSDEQNYRNIPPQGEKEYHKIYILMLVLASLLLVLEASLCTYKKKTLLSYIYFEIL